MTSKLTKAFSLLRKNGLIARQNLMRCQTCALAKMDDLVENACKKGKQIHGYVYYHAQDAEDRNAGRDFYLGFGWLGKITAVEPDRFAHTNVGREVCEVLAACGIQHKWNDSVNTRIKIIGGQV